MDILRRNSDKEVVMMNKALIFDIYKGTTNDGEGIRDTVFFKGCPLNCVWCHNPEGIEAGNRLWYDKNRCIGCAECVKGCENNALQLTEKGININHFMCNQCANCVSICPSNAIQFIGKYYTVEELAKEILKDKEYFIASNGGVTASGGECMRQSGFLTDFFAVMKENGINTALDTSGFCATSELKAVLEYTDCVLYDLKVMDSYLHKKWTGQDNRIIIKNLLCVKDYVKKNGIKLWIRTPIITGYTDNEAAISGIAEFIKTNLENSVQRWELCAFNNSCVKKYDKLSINWELKDYTLITKEKMANLLEIARSSTAKTVISSGIIKE